MKTIEEIIAELNARIANIQALGDEMPRLEQVEREIHPLNEPALLLLGSVKKAALHRKVLLDSFVSIRDTLTAIQPILQDAVAFKTALRKAVEELKGEEPKTVELYIDLPEDKNTFLFGELKLRFKN